MGDDDAQWNITDSAERSAEPAPGTGRDLRGDARRAAILSVGDELLLGQQLDTNSAWLSRALCALGWSVVEHRTIGDDRAAIAATLAALAERCEAVIVTGGLGPTLDDLTREALGDLLDPGTPLLEDPAGVAHLRGWFTSRGRPLAASNLRQALRPSTASLLPNPLGTAPGLAGRLRRRWAAGGVDTEAGCRIFCLPGPPREMEPMFVDFVAPELHRACARLVLTATVAQIGLGESAAADCLGDLMRRHRGAQGLPSVGTTASGGVVKARIRLECAASERDEGQRLIEEVVEEVQRRWRPYVYACRDETLVEALAGSLRSRGLTLAVAESCTGGLLGATLVELPGISDCFRGGFITYSNALKQELLGVPRPTLDAHGAVSAPTALAMVEGCRRRSGADCAIAITGVAGPDGGSEEKPVGTVWIAIAAPPEDPSQLPPGSTAARARRFLISGTRQDIRERSVALALQMLRLELSGAGATPLLWEVGAAGASA